MVPYIVKEGKRLILDIQVGKIQTLKEAKYEILLTYPDFDSAAACYHEEWASFFSAQNDHSKSIEAASKSLSIFDQNDSLKSNLLAEHEFFLVLAINKATHEERWDDCVKLYTELTGWQSRLISHPTIADRQRLVRRKVQLAICEKNAKITLQHTP